MNASGTISLREDSFGQLSDGRQTRRFTVETPAGAAFSFTDFGAILISASVPDRDGARDDVVLGYDDVAGYERGTSYLGCVVGRYANRIAMGRFELEGKVYRLAQNQGTNHLHGGEQGFNRCLWTPRASIVGDSARIAFEYRSDAGEEGYPGNLDVQVVYTIGPDATVDIRYSARTDETTLVNLTQHSYFNLGGVASDDVLGNQLWLSANRFTPVDASLIPTGELRAVEGTPFDFREPVALGARIDMDDAQLQQARGYDHNWVLDGSPGELRHVARVFEPATGRILDVDTTEPGVQLYSGNFLTGDDVGKGGRRHHRRGALCLETQHYPDSPNRPEFPSTVLMPGDEYVSRTIFRFSATASRSWPATKPE